MNKRIIFLMGASLLSLLVVLIAVAPPQVHASLPSPDKTQLFGQKTGGSYFGARADVKAPDISISTGWTAGLSGVSTWTGPSFFEAGAIRQPTGAPYPFSAWRTESGVQNVAYRVDISLTPGAYYNFRAYYVSSDIWDSYVQVGGTLYMITSQRLGRTTGFPYLNAGGESLPFGNRISTGVANNKWYNGSSWTSWCYTPPPYINIPGGTVSSCNTSNYSWLANY